MNQKTSPPRRHRHRQAACGLSRKLLHGPGFALRRAGEAEAVQQQRQRNHRFLRAANPAPMQMRGPAPKGRYWNLSIAPRFSGQKRDGINASGWSHSARCRCSVHGIRHPRPDFDVAKTVIANRRAVDRSGRGIKAERLFEGRSREGKKLEPVLRLRHFAIKERTKTITP